MYVRYDMIIIMVIDIDAETRRVSYVIANEKWKWKWKFGAQL